MHFLSNMKIGARMSLAFGLLIALLVLSCVFGAVTVSQLAADLEKTIGTDMADVQAASALQQRAGLVARAARELLIVDSAGQIKKQRELVTRSLKESDELIKALAAHQDSSTASQLVGKVTTAQDDFTKAVTKFLTVL